MAFSLPTRLKTAWHILTHRADALSDIRHPTAWLSDWAVGGRSTAGMNVSPSGALALSAYYGAMRAIAEDVGKLPLITYERLDRGKRRALEHPAYTLLHDVANEDMTAMTFRETLTAWVLGWGNGYAEIVRDMAGRPRALYPIHPSRVTVLRDEDGRLVYDVRADTTVYTEAGQPADMIRFQQNSILHLRNLGDGLQGYSIARLGAESLGLSLAAQTFGAAFFGNGTHVAGVLTHPMHLTETAMDNLRRSWAEMHAGPESANKPAILEEGMKWERTGIPPEEAQFLQTREFQTVEMCRWFRMPPHKVQHLEHASFTNIEHQGLEYVVDTMQPHLVRWEQELKRKLFGIQQPYFAEHLTLGLLRGDQAARASYYNTRLQMGTLTPNQIRELENENPSDDPAMDLYYMQLNMAPIGEPVVPSGPAPPGRPPVATSPGSNGVHYDAN